MDLFKYVAILFYFVISVKSEICIETKNNKWEPKLLRDLKKCYEDENQATRNATPVILKLNLKKFYFGSTEEALFMYWWIHKIWNDKKLKWDPKDYDGIQDMIMRNNFFWTPRVDLQNDSYWLEDRLFDIIDCNVKHDGNVNCISPNLQAVDCITDLKDWPFDTQTCTINFVTKTKNGVEFVYTARTLRMLGAEYGQGWTIIDYLEEIKDNKIKIDIILEREFTSVTAFIVVPVISAYILLLISLFLDVNNETRLPIILFAVILQFYNLGVLSEMIPHHGSDTPKILQFLKVSLFLSKLSLFFTLILVKLRSSTCSMPWRIAVINNYLRKGWFKYLIWPKWEPTSLNLTIAEDLLEKSNNIEEWTEFANILNTLWIFIVFILNLVLYFVLMPKK